jgi:hypothetical protein
VRCDILGKALGQKFVRLFIFAVFLMMLGALAIQLHLVVIAPQNLKAPPDWLTDYRLKALDLDAQSCSTALEKAGINGSLKPDEVRSNACRLEGTVMLSRLSKSHLKEEQTRCNIAARLFMWERNVVQPTAQKYFGQNVKEISHFGSYNCRTIRNSHAMSEHATANAIDISGVKLADGKFISIRKDWNSDGPEAQFLRELRDGICNYFNLTLSPDYNADHKDHFHVDMGWVRGCH